jgi:catechol 2,3-dioxygenase-like lactoylglutathione lyase family enzyme
MNPKMLFPMIVTDKLAETKEFYVGKAGFRVSFDMDCYLAVQYGEGENAPSLSFVSQKGLQMYQEKPFGGEGLIVSIPTEDADQKARQLKAVGIEPLIEPATRPWGWHSFLVRDPNGILLDFFHVPADTLADASS